MFDMCKQGGQFLGSIFYKLPDNLIFDVVLVILRVVFVISVISLN